jgi:signal transduction histidine kinase
MSQVAVRTEPKLWNLLFDTLPQPACVVRNGLVFDINSSMQRLLNTDDSDWLGQELATLLPASPSDKIYARMQRNGDGQLPCTLFINGVSMLYTCKWKSISASDDSFLLILEPVSSVLPTALEKDLYEDLQEQRDLIELMIETEEMEHKKFSDYLHDEVGSLLATAKHQLDIASQSLHNNASASLQEINKSIDLVDRSINQLRTIAMHTAPVSVEFGLISALQYLSETLNRKSNLNVKLIFIPENISLPRSLEIITYRTVQELLNNSIRHSEATEIILQLVQHPTSLSIIVEDNGKGFDYRKEKSKKGTIGLKKIMQRVELFDGKIEVDSTPGKGTVITIDLSIC